MMTRAAALTAALCFLASPAFAGSSSRPILVGAMVVRSATVSTSSAGTVNGGVRVEQVATRGTAAPMLIAAGELRPMAPSGATRVQASGTGDVTVTLLY
jgi:hypothetical protein